jgi:flagellin
MGFSVNTNIAALQAQTYVNANSDFQGKTINRVTSGLRIVNSGDDAAGLAIANGIRSDSAVLTQGIRNANDGLSQLQIIDGGINNISKLLDRARTLATQSASGTFTGSRTVLNSEFQSVIQEVDRQAQAIGLNSGGSFARSLSVFIGGGKASNGISASSNGSASVDLSQSTVDAQSLGLKGVQAKGTDATDIGTGSSTTSLSQILSNTDNTNSQAVANTAQFTLRGPGFGSQGVNISVNTNSVGGTSDLVTRVNAAIEAAGNGGTQAATALKNANIKASVVTDSSGRQQLAFTSPTTAFQVEAGDRTANALLGKYERNAALTGSNSAVSIDTSGGGTANVLTLAFEGGSAFNVTLTANAVQGRTSKGSLVAQLNADSGFSAKAKAYLSGDQLVIKSKDNTSSSQIVVTDTTLSRNLGLTSSASAVTVTAGAASTGADVTTRVQGNRAVAGGATARSTDNNATLTIAGASDNLNLTIAGKTGSLTLTNGTGLTKQQIAADINTQITASGTGANGLDGLVSASVVNNQIVLTAANAGDSVTIATGTNAAGFTAGESFTSNTFYSNDNIKVRFQGGGLESPVDISLNATTSGTTTVSTVLTDLVSRVATNSSLQAAGITLSSTSSGNNLVFQSASGETFQVAVTGDTQNKLGFGSFQANSSAAFDYSTIEATNTFTGTFDPAFASQTSTIEFSLNGGASSGNAITVTQLADRGILNATAQGTGNITLGGTTLNLSIDGGATTQAFTLTSGTTLSALAAEINLTITGGVADVVGTGPDTALRIRSLTTGAASSVVVQTGSTAAAALGLSIGQVGQGNSATAIQNDIRDQINTAIAGDAELRNAGLQASFSANKLTLASNNNTFFRVNTFGNTDLGFGVNGSSYSGTEVQGASATSATINSGGADSTTSLTFTGIAFGGDDQQVNITASDAAGTKQSLSVTLRNDATSRNARTIDDAVKAINDSLQQSNNDTLKKIFAVKENTGGAEKIRFLSTVKNFEVAIGSTPGSTGFSQPTGGIDKAATVGTGSNASIDTQAAAESAVAALADAVSALGTSQAVVGRGQNQFNFAVNLAQSQLTNLAASESRIRDADLASEAANLSKAQILIQAGVAALAQANSAPQQVLSLLRG